MSFGLLTVHYYSNHSVVLLGQTFRDSGFGGILGAPRDLVFPAIDRHSLQRQ